jgi:hypothetical protein
MHSQSTDQQRFYVRLTPLGFQVVERATGSVVMGHTGSGCRNLNGRPVFAARHLAQQVCDDMNGGES